MPQLAGTVDPIVVVVETSVVEVVLEVPHLLGPVVAVSDTSLGWSSSVSRKQKPWCRVSVVEKKVYQEQLSVVMQTRLQSNSVRVFGTADIKLSSMSPTMLDPQVSMQSTFSEIQFVQSFTDSQDL